MSSPAGRSANEPVHKHRPYSGVVISEGDLRQLSADERAQLLRLLARQWAAPQLPERVKRIRTAIVAILFAAVILLIGWIVVLGFTLPDSSTTHAWNVAWIGLDVAEVVTLAITAWAAWRVRYILLPAALIGGTLLVCDAWFDVVLSWGGDGWVLSVLSAVLLELPLAGLLWWVSYRLIQRGIWLARLRAGLDGPIPKLRDLRLFQPLDTPN